MTNNQCDICQKVLSNKYTLTTHRKTHQDRKKNFACDCGLKFLTENHRKKHRFTVHQSERLFVCEICSKTFKTLSNLETHQAAHLEKSFLCRFCEKTFSRLQDIRIHEKIHKNLKDFKCSDCEKSFTQQSNLLSHVKAVSPEV